MAAMDESGSAIHTVEIRILRRVRKVGNWLVSESGEKAAGAARILNAYADFQEWHYKRQLEAGFSEEDIQDYPTNELLEAMRQWIAHGRPV